MTSTPDPYPAESSAPTAPIRPSLTIEQRLAAHHERERARGKVLVPYAGDLLSPLPGLLDSEAGWRARERWYLRQIDQEWDDAEADLHDQPRSRR